MDEGMDEQVPPITVRLAWENHRVYIHNRLEERTAGQPLSYELGVVPRQP